MGRHVISLLFDVTKRHNYVCFIRDGGREYWVFKDKIDLFKRWHPKNARKRIQHAFVDRIHNSVPRDAKQWPTNACWTLFLTYFWVPAL